MYPDDTGKALATVLSYIAGRTLSNEEIWKAMELPRSTYYDQLEKGKLITADNLRTVAANLGINRAELLTRYRLIEPEEVAALAQEIRLAAPFTVRPGMDWGDDDLRQDDGGKAYPEKPAKISRLRPRPDAPPL